VDVEQRPQLLVGRLLDRADLGAAGVVDEDVDAPEAPPRLGDGRLALGGVGDVEAHGVQALAAVQLAERVRTASRGRDHVPPCQRRLRDRAPEAARCPRNQPDAVVAAHRRRAYPTLSTGWR
jgi:hypothetical protein